MNLDGTTTQQPTEFQQRWTNEHWMLQYDLMFGKGYALNRMGVAGLSGHEYGQIREKRESFFIQNRENHLQPAFFLCYYNKALHTHHYALLCPFGLRAVCRYPMYRADHGVRR